MNPAVILGKIIDTMRHDHATGEAGEIMIKGLECLLAVDLAMTVERAQKFLLLGIDAQNRVASREKLLDEMAQMAKLRVAMRRVAGKTLAIWRRANPSVSSRRRTMRGPAQTPWACRRSVISRISTAAARSACTRWPRLRSGWCARRTSGACCRS